MSDNLFVADPRSARTPSRQSSLVLASILLHGAAVVAIGIVSIVIPGGLPTPHVAALAWSEPQKVRLVDIPLEPQPAVVRRAAVKVTPSSEAAPVVAPTGIALEPEAVPGIVALPGTVEGPGVVNLGVAEPVALPPIAPPQAVTPVRLHSGIDAPVKVRDVVPQYPTMARAARAKGLVIIEATIDINGDVTGTRVLRSVPLLDEAALNAVRQWKYTPAKLNGEPVAVLITVTVNFTLEQ